MLSELDRISASLMKLIDSVVRRTDYHALYPATVVTQNGDGTLELRPDSTRVPSLSKVPIRLGIPGSTATVAAGARVLLGFEGGDGKRPMATLWDTSELVTLTIMSGTHDVARVTSAVTGRAGPYPVTAQVDDGYAGVKVP